MSDDASEIARACYKAYVDKDRTAIEALIAEGEIVEVEVYFGWSLPHPAPEGGFVEPDGLTSE